jgi:cytochrome c553
MHKTLAPSSGLRARPGPVRSSRRHAAAGGPHRRLGGLTLFAVLACCGVAFAADVAATEPETDDPAADPAAVAQAEYDAVMALTPDIDNGRRAYLTCAVCHLPEGWGSADGNYPQIAGQLRTVIIKQLADFRAGNRDNPLMYPFSVPGILGGPQEIADVAAYVAQLPMTPHNGLGPGTDLALGERLYEDNCVDCHGPAGEGDVKEHIPAVAGQHYAYLMRQFEDIREGRRRNSDPKMVEQIQGFTPEEQAAVLDYTARLRPPAEKLAPEGWVNPDFPAYVRDAAGIRATPPAPPPAE